jgi:hypothetical protein
MHRSEFFEREFKCIFGRAFRVNDKKDDKNKTFLSD